MILSILNLWGPPTDMTLITDMLWAVEVWGFKSVPGVSWDTYDVIRFLALGNLGQGAPQSSCQTFSCLFRRANMTATTE